MTVFLLHSPDKKKNTEIIILSNGLAANEKVKNSLCKVIRYGIRGLEG